MLLRLLVFEERSLLVLRFPMKGMTRDKGCGSGTGSQLLWLLLFVEQCGRRLLLMFLAF